MLTFHDVTVSYGEYDAVRAVTFPVAEGSWMGLIGPNGAGKSSLLRAVAHIERFRGLITVAGQNVHELSHRQSARLVAYVPQQPELPGGMSVLSYTLLGRTPHIGHFGVESAADTRLCLSLLDRLGVAGLAERMLPTLSGGEVQRVVLARALAQQAPLLLLDEPTSALDVGNRVTALELVDQMRVELGLTVVAVMHDLTLAGQFADVLTLLDEGQVASSGTPAEVLTERRLRGIFGDSVRVIVSEDGAPIVVPARARPRADVAPGTSVGAQRQIESRTSHA